MNDELRDRTDEALRGSSFLASILWSVEQVCSPLEEVQCVILVVSAEPDV